MEAPKPKPKRKATAQACALTSTSTPTPRQLKISKMLELAAECGFICQAYTEYYTELANAIASRLVHRLGTSVYQSVNFTIPLFARDAAIQLFGTTGLTMTTEHRVNWKLTTMAECAVVMEKLTLHYQAHSLLGAGAHFQGLSRALLSESEITSLVIATIMPTLEATWESLAKGGCRLKIGFMYVLMDCDGELHAPKDEQRRELALSSSLEASLRERVLIDANLMIERGVPMASGWYRQVGLPREATLVAADEAAGKLPQKPKAVKPGKLGVTKRNHYNVAKIIKEVATMGRAKEWFLVEWEGYHASWEVERINGVVGGPIQTWERLGVICNTEAFWVWRGWELV